MRRYFDPPSLQKWIASGNLSKEQAAHLKELIDAGRFEDGIRYGLSLPETSLARPAVIFFSWFSWAVADRDAAMEGWTTKPGLHADAAQDGLIQGCVFSTKGGNATWLSACRNTAPEGFDALLLKAGSMWLISGDLSVQDLLHLTKRADWQAWTNDELAALMEEWSQTATDLVTTGRLKKSDALETLAKFQSITEQTTAEFESGTGPLAAMFSSTTGLWSGRVCGALESIASYGPPTDEKYRSEFLRGLGTGLANQESTQVLPLVSPMDPEGKTIWRAYVWEKAGPDAPAALVKTLSDPRIPETLVEEGMDAVFHPQPAIPLMEKELFRLSSELEMLPPSHVKKRFLLEKAKQRELHGDHEEAAAYRAMAAEIPD